MSKTIQRPVLPSSLIEVKSKFEAEFRRFSIERHKCEKLKEFEELIEEIHEFSSTPITLSYIDPKDSYLLPITNDDNFKKSLETARPTLKIIVQRKGENYEYQPNGSGTGNRFPSLLSPFVHQPKNKLTISNPKDFRQVAQIIDVETVPDVCRRVRLLKHGSDKPLGFYIRDGTGYRRTLNGMERVPGIFISRLVPGGLAESTGLLAVNDEVIEVNGIEVQGKTLDQVTDMMVANSTNLIITVKPAKSHTTLSYCGSNRDSFSRNSAMSSGSRNSHQSQQSQVSDDDNCEDEIRDLTQATNLDIPLNKDDEAILHL